MITLEGERALFTLPIAIADGPVAKEANRKSAIGNWQSPQYFAEPHKVYGPAGNDAYNFPSASFPC